MKPLIDQYDAATGAGKRAIVADLIERHRVLEAICVDIMDASSLPELEVVIRRQLPAAMLRGQTPFEGMRDVCRVV